MIYYKIRNKNNPDEYVRGTPYHWSYDKSGRVFQKIGQVRTFITGILNNPYRKNELGSWEVVELEMVEIGAKDIHQVVRPEKIKDLLMRQ
jgi:20S proteasome alpha/beta subunit